MAIIIKNGGSSILRIEDDHVVLPSNNAAHATCMAELSDALALLVDAAPASDHPAIVERRRRRRTATGAFLGLFEHSTNVCVVGRKTFGSALVNRSLSAMRTSVAKYQRKMLRD